ncbi:MAG: hypothetical protein OJF47_000235 [Nitrospira sp.]|jgi:hypothetical protein|nr:MAG: hypothetical protein OJF47_000235 [Nitrospira sp.]
MNKQDDRRLGRVEYWEGQMLRAGDFLDNQRVEAQRRWWHNRALHQAYGIYQGFAATLIKDHKGRPAAIKVTSGVAYDCFGRELVLDCNARVPLAATTAAKNGLLILLVRYRDLPSRDVTDARSASCCLAGEQVSSGTVEFVWSEDDGTAHLEGVALGRLMYSEGLVKRFVASAKPPISRPLARPTLGTGSTVPGNTPWQPWEYHSIGSERNSFTFEIGVQTRIDTSAAGFTDIPQYFAWLQGPIWNPQTMQLVPALLPSLADETIDGFTFRLILLPPREDVIFLTKSASVFQRRIHPVRDSNSFAVFARQQKLSVVWLGCQMPPKTAFLSQEPTLHGKVFQSEAIVKKT